MKNAVILHGHGSTENSFWHPYLKRNLEKRGYTVWLPTLPDTQHPVLDKQLSFVIDNFEFTPESVIVGHSSGVPLAISLIEKLEFDIRLAVLVAGFITAVDKEARNMLQSTYDWKKIKSNLKQAIIINSDNDPWGCNHEQGLKLFVKLGGMQIILHGEGHMGSDTFKQPYREFPLLVKFIEVYD